MAMKLAERQLSLFGSTAADLETVANDQAAARLAALARVDSLNFTPPSIRTRDGRKFTFYLGAHRGRWMERGHGVFGPPLFISANTLAAYSTTRDNYYETFPRGIRGYAVDSGGFTELMQHGEWRLDADDYGGMIVRFMEDTCAVPDFVAPQDWMCEPWIISGGTHKGVRYAGTGLTVRDHIELTVENYLYLSENFYFVPWIPVLQGWTLDDYQLCYDLYVAAGVDLTAGTVGLGSVCRRESTEEIGQIVSHFAGLGLRLHGFGVKASGLRRYGHLLASADSMAWSRVARADRRNIRLPGCEHQGVCANCERWAMTWRELVLDTIAR